MTQIREKKSFDELLFDQTFFRRTRWRVVTNILKNSFFDGREEKDRVVNNS